MDYMIRLQHQSNSTSGRGARTSHKIHDVLTCAFAVKTKLSVISFGFLFQRLLWRHCKTFNIETGKSVSFTLVHAVVYFTLADLLETKKVQGATFRDCYWCISIPFASVYFDEN